MKFTITEVCTYEVEAETREQAEEAFAEYGPEISVESPVTFLGADERTIEPR